VRLDRAWTNIQGMAAVEFGLTAPIYFALLAGIVECGLLLWTQVGLQQGTGLAARCASISPTICSSTTAIQSYAAQHTFGLNPPPAVFSVSAPACGNQVNASYAFHFVSSYLGIPALTLSAQSCFPK